MDEEHDHGKMRRIASEWHGGMRSDLYAFASTGTIRYDLLAEVEDEVNNFAVLTDEDEVTMDELTELRDYVAECGIRGPREGWSEIWG